MQTNPLAHPIAAAIMAIACAGCAGSKSADADVDTPVTSAPAASTTDGDAPSEANTQEKPAPRQSIDDGLRLPDMLTLPSDRELRRQLPDPDTKENAGVSARPPVGTTDN